jgi:hypothetical protein
MMNLIKTKRQVTANESPTKLEILRELNNRYALDEDLTAEWQRLERGFMGSWKFTICSRNLAKKIGR